MLCACVIYVFTQKLEILWIQMAVCMWTAQDTWRRTIKPAKKGVHKSLCYPTSARHHEHAQVRSALGDNHGVFNERPSRCWEGNLSPSGWPGSTQKVLRWNAIDNWKDAKTPKIQQPIKASKTQNQKHPQMADEEANIENIFNSLIHVAERIFHAPSG